MNALLLPRRCYFRSDCPYHVIWPTHLLRTVVKPCIIPSTSVNSHTITQTLHLALVHIQTQFILVDESSQGQPPLLSYSSLLIHTPLVAYHEMSTTSWIEHGSNGRAYLVRKKPALPSVRQIFAEAFRDIRSSYSTTNQAAPAAPAPLRSLRPGNTPVSQVQAGAGNDQGTTNHKSSIKRSQTIMSQAQQRGGIAGDSGPPSQQPMPMQPQPIYLQHQPPFNIHPFLPPFQGWPQQQNIHQNTPKQEDGPSQADSGALTHYASPHPRMYPYVPPRTQPMPFHSMMPTPPPAGPPGQHSFQPGMMNLAQPASAMSSMSAQLYNMPLGQVPPKLKCNDCGRERSSKYQWKHRKSRGQKAEPNICRRCRKSGTDSEYETESSEDERDLPRRSRSRHYSRGRTSRAQSRARSKARSSSRPNRRGDFDFYAYHDVDNSDSDSGDSEDYQRNQSRSIRRRSRSRSGNLGRARNSQLRHSISRPRKVVYVEPRHDQVDFHSDDEDIGVRYVDRHARYVALI